ncbi:MULTISPECIES: OmpA family protein [Prauserella salsuginis group]|uniref:OmpA family protein n=1 Tax=Prauserella salsuginis TaxID=387889 RepID=A0ABW6G782_9PSEU|nr:MULTISPECIES: OmpA family protein [Prauserella salsuginis group]MCR3720776.1 Outer membrane protein OmpA [Prauserella flava]MCR3735143.1 Outer membrane protein OmpA [Prauserella salsuginis]
MAGKNGRFWLIPLAFAVSGLLAFGATWATADRIEHDLRDEAQAALRDAGMRAPSVTIDGRDVTVSDVPQGRGERARTVVDDLEGVGAVDVQEAQTGRAAARTQQAIDSALQRTPIRFAPYGDELTSSGSRAVTHVADILRSAPTTLRFEVAGHVAEVPNLDSDEARELSRERADAVATELADAGIPRDRLTTVGHGDSRPVDDGDDGESDRANRRVEIHVR